MLFEGNFYYKMDPVLHNTHDRTTWEHSGLRIATWEYGADHAHSRV